MAGYYIIGISGATNSGKSTLADQLTSGFPEARHICQDIYFLEPGNKNLEFVPEVNHANWEKLSAMDMDHMMEDIQLWKEKQQQKGNNSCPGLLIIEGILIFNHKELSTMFDKKYFLTLDFETCRERRKKRTYYPSDPPGYFDKVVWPMYLSNLQDIKHQKDIVFFSCDKNTKLSELCKKIITDIKSLHPAFSRNHFNQHSENLG